MKTIQLLNAALLFFAILFSACSKNNGELGSKRSIDGTWKWLSTDGGIANNIHDTPASTGDNLSLTLNRDNSYTITKNGTVSSQGSYTIIKKTCIHNNKQKEVIDFLSADTPDRMIENVDATTLELSDESYDGITTLYTRIAK